MLSTRESWPGTCITCLRPSRLSCRGPLVRILGTLNDALCSVIARTSPAPTTQEAKNWMEHMQTKNFGGKVGGNSYLTLPVTRIQLCVWVTRLLLMCDFERKLDQSPCLLDHSKERCFKKSIICLSKTKGRGQSFSCEPARLPDVVGTSRTQWIRILLLYFAVSSAA